MYFSDAVTVVARRWYVVVVAAVIMVVAMGAVIALVPTEYQASGQVLLLPPSERARETAPTNPYLSLPNGVTFTATLIASGATQPSVARDLANSGYESPYSVSVVPNTGPLIIVSVKDANPAAALALRDELIRRIESELDTIQEQESVPDGQRIVARRFNTADVAEVLAGSKIRALGALLALGTVLTALAVFAFDRLAPPRRRDQPRRTRTLDDDDHRWSPRSSPDDWSDAAADRSTDADRSDGEHGGDDAPVEFDDWVGGSEAVRW